MRNKLILVFFVLVQNLMGQDGSVFSVEKLNAGFDTAISFPVIRNCDGADSINRHLLKFLHHCFYCDDSENVEECLSKAATKDLKSIHFRFINSDTTVSFILYIKLKAENIENYSKSYLTFSLNKGNQLSVIDLFSTQDEARIFSFVHRYYATFLYNQRQVIFNQFQNGLISSDEFKLYDYHVVNMCQMGDLKNFVINNSMLCLNFPCLMPPSLYRYLPDDMSIDISWMAYNLNKD